VIGPFAYLILHSARNQLRARAARLRNPRYALALAIGLAYLWFVYLRPSADRPHAAGMLTGTTVALLPLPLLAFIAWIWLSGGDRSALAFSQAEVTMLFTAPVSRRTLVLYRIARTQLRILLTSLVWTLVFRETSSLGTAVTHALGYWVLLSTLNVHRLGVALVHASGGQHGLRGTRRHWIAIAVFMAIMAMVVVPVSAAWGRSADGRRYTNHRYASPIASASA
jgi:ABC-2 type transport system permease protein